MKTRKSNTNLQGIASLLVIVISLAWLVAACSQGENSKQGAKQKPLPNVKTIHAEIKTLAERLDLTGSIEPIRIAKMASPVEGPVIACLVREGDKVNTGQLLIRLGRAKGDDALASSAKEELMREELELGRIEKLVKSGALPGEELDKAKVKISAAQARLAKAMERLGDYRVTAPWKGVVSKVHVAVGDFVSARATLVELFDPDSLALRFAVPEASAIRVKDGASIAVILDAYPNQSFTAKVARVYPDIDRRTRTRMIEATINEDVTLLPGMFARLQLTLASAPDALAVPIESIIRRKGSSMVFVIANDKTVQKRPVKLGIEDRGWIQILSGVNKGETIAIAGHNKLREGKKVRVVGEQSKKSDGENAHHSGRKRKPE